MSLFWMSFCDPDRPKGRQFIGVALVEAPTLPDAITTAWRTGCNPGGEVQSTEIPIDRVPTEKRALLDATPRCTLMDLATLERYGLLP